MISLSINDTLRAGSLDASLAFSVIFEEHRLLVSQTVSSGVQGLIKSLDDLQSYQKAMTGLRDSVASLDEAAKKAALNPFGPASSTQITSVHNSINSGLFTQGAPYATAIDNAITGATNALNLTTSGTPERTAANEAKAAAEKAKSALEKVRAGDVSAGFTLAQQALTDAQTAKTHADQALTNANAAVTTANQALTAAQEQLAAAQAADPVVPADVTAANNAVTNAQNQLTAAQARVTAATAVVNAAAAVVTTCQNLVNFKNEPICQIKLASPSQHYDIGDGYTISTWGNTGYMTLTGPDGKGILIQPNGSVDPLSGSGEGWKFNTTSTLVLPNETKITITPNATSGATVSVTSGRNRLEITNLKSGSAATGEIGTGGRKADAESNDGYRIDMSGGTDVWRLAGQLLGDAASREVVAVSALNNKFPLDPTDVAISPELQEFLTELNIGAPEFDMDSDGKMNEEELSRVAVILLDIVNDMQDAFAKALENTAKANDALRELNRFLEEIQRQGDREQDGKSEATAAEKDTLAALQKRLESALSGLTSAPGGTVSPSTIKDAQNLLDGLNKLTGGTLETGNSTGTFSPTPPQGEETGPEETVDPLGQAMRRATLLLSGIGLNFKIDESQFPGETPPPALGESDVALLAALAGLGLPLGEDEVQALQDLVARLQGALGDGGTLTLNVEDQQLLEGILAGLAAGGLLPISEEDSQFLSDLMTQLQGLNLNLADTFELENLLARLQGPQAPEESSSPATGLSTDVRNFTIADIQRLSELLGRLQNLPLGLSADDTRRLEGFINRLQTELQGGSSAAGDGENPLRPVSLADVQRLGDLLARLQGEEPALVSFSIGGTSPGDEPIFQPQDALKTIIGNFETDPELLNRLKENLNKALKVYTEQLGRAQSLFEESKETVQEFVSIVSEDEALKEILKDDNLSDEERENFAAKMDDLNKKWGINWGSDSSDGTTTPAEEGKLVTKMAQSGMMV